MKSSIYETEKRKKKYKAFKTGGPARTRKSK